MSGFPTMVLIKNIKDKKPFKIIDKKKSKSYLDKMEVV